MMQKKIIHLHDLANVGKAVLRDLHILGIQTIEQLAAADPDELYTELETITGKHHDRCMWDVFAAIVHEARTGQKSSWWEWTQVRKQKEALHSLCEHRKKLKL